MKVPRVCSLFNYQREHSPWVLRMAKIGINLFKCLAPPNFLPERFHFIPDVLFPSDQTSRFHARWFPGKTTLTASFKHLRGSCKILGTKTETLCLIAGLRHDFDSYNTWFNIAASQKSPVKHVFLNRDWYVVIFQLLLLIRHHESKLIWWKTFLNLMTFMGN